MQKKYIGFFLGIAAFLAILLFADLEPGKPEVTTTMAVAALMAIWFGEQLLWTKGVHPYLLLMIPATLASSLAFMLPTATPPNAIIFGTNRINIGTMVRTGFMLNMLGIVVVVIVTWLYIRIISLACKKSTSASSWALRHFLPSCFLPIWSRVSRCTFFACQ